jgi:uncharacterized protein YeaO (DUF488 family)
VCVLDDVESSWETRSGAMADRPVSAGYVWSPKKEPCAMIRIKRVYGEVSADDGYRILVDRLWPRGVKKEGARVDLWLKEVAPSDKVRRDFGHRPEKWVEFKRAYWRELDQKGELIQRIMSIAEKATVTLLYGAADEQLNNAVVLREYIESKR